MSDGIRKRVGLALGGGVVRGLAHIGVLTILEQEQIPIDYVVGTSAGSLVGAAYCAGLDPDRLRQFGLTLHWWNIARPVWPRLGFLCFDRLANLLVAQVGDLQFSDLRIPFAAVATDLETGNPVTLSKGRLAPAVQASCSVPGIVCPVEINGVMLGDGCLSDTLPVSVLRQMGADYVIAVDIFEPSMRPRLGALGMGLNAIEILIQRAGGGIDEADCLISPDLAGKTYLRFSKRDEFYQLGVQAVRDKLDDIRIGLGQIEAQNLS